MLSELYNRLVYGKRKRISKMLLRDICMFNKIALKPTNTIVKYNIAVYRGSDYECLDDMYYFKLAKTYYNIIKK